MEKGVDVWWDEYRFRCADGHYVDFFDRGHIRCDKKDTPIRLVGSMMNITERKSAQEALRVSETHYRLLAENARDVIWTVGMDMRLTHVSPSVTRLLGFTEEEAMARTMQEAFTPASFEKTIQIFAEEMEIENAGHGEPNRSRILELELIRKDRNTIPVEGNFCFLCDTTGKVIGILSILRDITERKQAEEILLESAEQYRTLVENASDIVFRLDNTGHITFVNPAALSIMGYEEKEFIGRHYPTFIRSDMQEEAMNFFGRQFVKGIPNTYSEYPVIVKDGQEIWLGQNTQLIIEDDRVVGFQAVARDITERKRMEEKFLALSVTDQLTGLYNRRGFLFHAEQKLKLSERNKSKLLLFFADLDLLKWINDSLGHEEGDKALIESANILKETFSTSDIIARLGGDEFAILAIDIDGVNPEVFTARLQRLIDIWNNQENRKYKLSISIGGAYYDPEKPSSIDDLIARANKMIYEQKQNKKGLLL